MFYYYYYTCTGIYLGVGRWGENVIRGPSPFEADICCDDFADLSDRDAADNFFGWWTGAWGTSSNKIT